MTSTLTYEFDSALFEPIIDDSPNTVSSTKSRISIYGYSYSSLDSPVFCDSSTGDLGLVDITNAKLAIPSQISSKSKKNFHNYCLSRYSFLRNNPKIFIADHDQLGLVIDNNEFVNASFVFLNNTRVRFVIKNKVSYKKVLIQGEIYLDESIKNKERYLFGLYEFFDNKDLVK